MLAIPEPSPQRKTSIKAKLRSISINRHKHEETTDRSMPTDSRRSSASQQFDHELEGADRSRARSPARALPLDNAPDSSGSLEAAPLKTTPTMSEPQLAAPIVTPSVVQSYDRPSHGDAEPATASHTDPVVILENVKVKDDVVEPVPVATGFLSSVFNAATNFGTVLGTNSPRSIMVRSPKQGNDSFQDSPARSSTIQSLGSSVLKQDESTTTGELSLKDMGIIDQVPQDQPAESRSRASSRTATAQNTAVAIDADAKRESRPNRSGSVATTQSRRRRGSTAMSVFSGGDGQGQKITGFAVASNKRNREFHATFRSVPDADYLLDDYGCALQKEILVHGRMYVSESHICFNSNIFGWVTNLVISFMDITALEKKSTAGIFPNAIQISTQQARHVFASFISRDTTFDLIVNIWRLTHPSIQTTAHGVEVAGTDGDELYESDSEESEASDEEEGSLEQSLLESDDEVEVASFSQAGISPNETPLLPEVQDEPKVSAASETMDFPGPREHAPTEAPSLSDGTAYAKPLIDECFNAPLGRIYELIYGHDTAFMIDFLSSNQKLLDVQVGQFSDKQGKTARSISYVKPLSGPIGPKQTRCLTEDLVEVKDFNTCIQVVQTTTSPDVPSGDAFAIKTRFSLMWGPRNTTRIVTNCTIEWSKTSWIKGPIEKASNAGQVQFMADLSDALRSTLNSGINGKKKKARSKRSRSGNDQHNKAAPETSTQSAPAEGIMANILGIAQNINIHALTLILLFGMMFAMIRMQRTIHELAHQREVGQAGSSLASYNWLREETNLWEWLAERTFLSEQSTASGQSLGSMNHAQVREALAQAKIRTAVLEEAEQLATKKPVL